MRRYEPEPSGVAGLALDAVIWLATQWQGFVAGTAFGVMAIAIPAVLIASRAGGHHG